MKEALATLLDAIKNDYFEYMNRNKRSDSLSETQLSMIDEFNAGLEITEGKKYIKVITQNSVWGFIVKKDDAKFRAGDILKAASWASPARNSARGNILDGGYDIQWTGPNYLR